jgi:hypothetical protein
MKAYGCMDIQNVPHKVYRISGCYFMSNFEQKECTKRMPSASIVMYMHDHKIDLYYRTVHIQIKLCFS